jgi:hypothetical protein
MGYDFSFMIVAPRPAVLPFYLHKDFDGKVEQLRDPRAVERALLAEAGFRLNGPPIAGRQWYRWESPDEGNLGVSVWHDAVFVDTHAYWRCVLRLYELLLSHEPDLLIVDNQTAMLYDAASYRRFIDESYARKAALSEAEARDGI